MLEYWIKEEKTFVINFAIKKVAARVGIELWVEGLNKKLFNSAPREISQALMWSFRDDEFSNWWLLERIEEILSSN